MGWAASPLWAHHPHKSTARLLAGAGKHCGEKWATLVPPGTELVNCSSHVRSGRDPTIQDADEA